MRDNEPMVLSRRSTLICFLLLAAATLPGCGRYARDASNGPSTTQADVAVGSGVGVASTAPTTAPPPPATDGSSSGGAKGAKPTASTAAPPPANPITTTHPSGLRLTLGVDGDLTYAPSEDILFDFFVDNPTTKPIYWDPNELSHFLMRSVNDSSTWRDTDCRARPADVEAGATAIEPGERLEFTATYPGPKDRSTRETCRKKPGTYDVLGRIEWCSQGPSADGTCAPGTTRDAQSGTVRLVIG